MASISETAITEQEMQNYIFRMCPGISHAEMWEVRNKFIYDFIPLENAVKIYNHNKQIKEWNKRKDKKYYKVRMLNGGYKFVYMCKEMVELFYGHLGYELA